MGNTSQNVTCCSLRYMIWNIWSNLWKIFALIRRYIGSLIWCVVIQDIKKKVASKGRFLKSMVLLIQMYPVLERWCISRTVSNQVEVSPWSVAKCPDWLCCGAMLYCVCKNCACVDRSYLHSDSKHLSEKVGFFWKTASIISQLQRIQQLNNQEQEKSP